MRRLRLLRQKSTQGPRVALEGNYSLTLYVGFRVELKALLSVV